MRPCLAILLLAIAACNHLPPDADPDHEARHYQVYHEESGWHPDYHDK